MSPRPGCRVDDALGAPGCGGGAGLWGRRRAVGGVPRCWGCAQRCGGSSPGILEAQRTPPWDGDLAGCGGGVFLPRPRCCRLPLARGSGGGGRGRGRRGPPRQARRRGVWDGALDSTRLATVLLAYLGWRERCSGAPRRLEPHRHDRPPHGHRPQNVHTVHSYMPFGQGSLKKTKETNVTLADAPAQCSTRRP